MEWDYTGSQGKIDDDEMWELPQLGRCVEADGLTMTMKLAGLCHAYRLEET